MSPCFASCYLVGLYASYNEHDPNEKLFRCEIERLPRRFGQPARAISPICKVGYLHPIYDHRYPSKLLCFNERGDQ